MSALNKDSEISSSLYIDAFFLVIFGLWGLARLFMLFFDHSLISILIAIFVCAIAIQSFSTLRALRVLRKNFRSNPDKHRDSVVPKPILYHAVFWFLPRY